MPPKEIVEAFDAPPLPTAILSPSRQVIALISRRAYPTIADLSQPILRLAGERINPKTNGPQRTAGIYAITLKKIADGSDVKLPYWRRQIFPQCALFAGWRFVSRF
jgi:hypothetical protein